MSASLEAAAEFFLAPVQRPPRLGNNPTKLPRGSPSLIHERMRKRIFGQKECRNDLIPGSTYKEKPGSCTEASMLLLLERMQRLQHRHRQQDLEEIMFEINRQAVESESLVRAVHLETELGHIAEENLRRNALRCLALGDHRPQRQPPEREVSPPSWDSTEYERYSSFPTTDCNTTLSASTPGALLAGLENGNHSSYDNQRSTFGGNSTTTLQRKTSSRASSRGAGGLPPRAMSRGSECSGGSSIGFDATGGAPAGGGYMSVAPFPITEWHGEMPEPLQMEALVDPEEAYRQERELAWNSSVLPQRVVPLIYQQQQTKTLHRLPGDSSNVQLPAVEEMLRTIKERGVAAADPTSATTQTVCALFTYGQPQQRSERLQVVAPVLSKITIPPKPKSYRAILEEKIMLGEIDMSNDEVRRSVSELLDGPPVPRAQKKSIRQTIRSRKQLPPRSVSAPLGVTSTAPPTQESYQGGESDLAGRAASCLLERDDDTTSTSSNECLAEHGHSHPSINDPPPRTDSASGLPPVETTTGSVSHVVLQEHLSDEQPNQCPPAESESTGEVPNGDMCEVPSEALMLGTAEDSAKKSSVPAPQAHRKAPAAEKTKPKPQRVEKKPIAARRRVNNAAPQQMAPTPIKEDAVCTSAGSHQQSEAPQSADVSEKTVVLAAPSEGPATVSVKPSPTSRKPIKTLPGPPPSMGQKCPTPNTSKSAAPQRIPSVAPKKNTATAVNRSPAKRSEVAMKGKSPTVVDACRAPVEPLHVEPRHEYDEDFDEPEGHRPVNASHEIDVPHSAQPSTIVDSSDATAASAANDYDDDGFEEPSPTRSDGVLLASHSAGEKSEVDQPPSKGTTPVVEQSTRCEADPMDPEDEETYEDDPFDSPPPPGTAGREFEDIGNADDDEYSSDENASGDDATTTTNVSVPQQVEEHTQACAVDESEGDAYANALSMALRQRMKTKLSPKDAPAAVVLPPPEVMDAIQSGYTSRSVSAEPQQRPDSKHRGRSRGSTAGGDSRPQYTARDFFSDDVHGASVVDDPHMHLLRPTSRASADNRSRTPTATPTASEGPYSWSRSTPPPEDDDDDHVPFQTEFDGETRRRKGKKRSSKDKKNTPSGTSAVTMEGFVEIDVGMPSLLTDDAPGKKKRSKKSKKAEPESTPPDASRALREEGGRRRRSNNGMAFDL